MRPGSGAPDVHPARRHRRFHRERLVEGGHAGVGEGKPLGAREAVERLLRERPGAVTDPLLDPAKPAPREKVLEGFARYRDGFMVHPDGRSVTLVVRPTGTSLGVAEARSLLDRMRAIADRHLEYADAVEAQLKAAGLRGTLDRRVEKIGYKIREAQLQKVPYMLVIGDREVAEGTVSVRTRLGGDQGGAPVSDFVTSARDEVARRV